MPDEAQTSDAQDETEVISRKVKAEETPESELPTQRMAVKCSRCHVPGHTADKCMLVPPRGTPRGDVHRGGTP